MIAAGLLGAVGSLPAAAQDADGTCAPSPEALLPGGVPQRLLIPAYFAAESGKWELLIAQAPRETIVIFNPQNGPDVGPYAPYQVLVAQAQAAGLRVTGYVKTGFGTTPASTVTTDIDRYRLWYDVDDVFFDEVSATEANFEFYRDLSTYVREAGGRVVFSPGWYPDIEEYMALCEILVKWEQAYAGYRDFTFPSWVYAYGPERFAHIVYATPNHNAFATVLKLSRQRNSAWLWVTGDTNPSPFNTLGSFYHQLLAHVGGCGIEDAAPGSTASTT